MKNIRQILFWSIDFIKGGMIAKDYREIINYKTKDADEQLKEILKYVIEHVPFYKGKAYNSLQDFPVVSKKIFKEEGVNCISDEYPNYTSLYTAKTSGSTGTPLTIYMDARKRRRITADLLVINQKIGFELGCHYVYLRNWLSDKKQSKIERFAKNYMPVGLGDFDELHKEKLYKHLQKNKHTVIVGYSSSVCDFMEYIKRTGKDAKSLKIKLIHCSAEDLPEYRRKELREVFGCPVYNRYSNQEVGLIAMMMDYDDVFQVNEPSVRMELLKLDRDEYVKPGEMGRVVLTDLYNRAMPLVRYDVGDLAVSYDDPSNVKKIVKLCGRTGDLLRAPGGILVGSASPTAAAEIYPEIEKWQFAQISEREFEFRYVGILSKEQEGELKDRLHDSIGNLSIINVIKKDDLPVGKNGKFKIIVNEVSK